MRSRLYSFIRVIGTIVSRFKAENMTQTSAALAFATLLALVPLVTLVLSLASTIPFFDTLVHRLDAMLVQNLLPPGSNGTIAGYIVNSPTRRKSLPCPASPCLG